MNLDRHFYNLLNLIKWYWNNKMNKKLRNYLITGTAILSTLIPKLANAQEINGVTSRDVIGNSFSQMNIHSQVGRNWLDWYGSGDVNNDEVINQTDVNEILGSTSDRADVDGDGTPGTNADKSKLEEFVNGEINYLPGHWNELTTEAERTSWLEKMLAIQDMEQYYSISGWVCANYITQMQIDFTGISNIDEFITQIEDGGGVTYNGEDNARFNIPFYHVGTTNTSGVLHAAAGVLVGDNPLDFNDWYFLNYANDDRVYPGNFHMDENSPVDIGLAAYVQDLYLPDYKFFASFQNLIDWDLNNGIATYTGKDKMIITENPNIMEVDVEPIADAQVQYTNPVNADSTITGTPNVTTANTSLEATLIHEDGTKIPLNTTYPNHHYQFTRTWHASLYSGGITKKDTTSQLITVEDTESPNYTMPENTSILEEEPMNPSTTGSPTNVTDNSELPVELTVNYTLISEDENEQIHNAKWTGTDVFGNTTQKDQQVKVLKAKIELGDLENLVLNYSSGQDLSRENLTILGYEAIPEVIVYNSTQTPEENSTDGENIPLSQEYPEINYQFTRTHTASILVNGEERTDLTEQLITIEDSEAPNFTKPNDITISDTEPLNPESTGNPTNPTDNSNLPVELTVNYNLVSEDESIAIYDAVWTGTDVFNNSTEKTQKVTVTKTPADYINVNPLENILMNFTEGQNLSPDSLQAKGLPGIPTVDSNTTYDLTSTDHDTTYYSPLRTPDGNPIEYSFIRTHTGTTTSGDATDSENQKIEVRDNEKPKFTMPEDKTLSKEIPLTIENTGYPTNISDNSKLACDTNYVATKISEDGQNEYYEIAITLTDKFGNDSTQYQNITKDIETAIENMENIPIVFELQQNYPNPFNANTTIRFTNDISGNVIFKLFNVRGEKLRTFVNSSTLGENRFSINFSGYASGKYILTMQVPAHPLKTIELLYIK
jgi:hypothetical protein